MTDVARAPRTTPAPKRKKRAPAAPSPAARAPRSAKRRGPAGPRRRALVWGGAAALITIAALGVLLFVGFGSSRGPTAAPSVELDWPEQTTSGEAAALLAERGLVTSTEVMVAFLDATGGTDGFIPGTHLLPGGSTPWELRRLLRRDPSRPSVKVAIPEGWNRFEMASRFEKLGIVGRRSFLAATADPALLDELGIERAGAVGAESAEGYLFPATYDLHLDADPRQLVRLLVKESDRRWEALSAQHAAGLASLAATLGWTRREVLTLASLVEKEAVVHEERPLIASVFLNRLIDPTFTPKRLQSDPTSMYGCLVAADEIPACASFQGKPSPAINTDPRNRYSTYVHAGLPPGPIANPGDRSVAGVLTPATSRYLYFVAAGAGRHTFSETLGAHNDAVRKLRASSP